jgi:hypothetical protein
LPATNGLIAVTVLPPFARRSTLAGKPLVLAAALV